jgi:hypothetical protein
MPEDGVQLFQFQVRGDAEHAVAIETSVHHQDVAMGVESEEVAKCLYGDNGAGDGFIFGNLLLKKDLQRSFLCVQS